MLLCTRFQYMPLFFCFSLLELAGVAEDIILKKFVI